MTQDRLRPMLSGVVLRSQSDARLAGLAAEGHQLAFTTIFERYRRELDAHAGGIVRPDQSDDIVQHAMLRAWSALLSGETVAEPRAWLHRIVHNVALNTLARRGYSDGEIPAGTVSLMLTDDVAEARMSAAEALAAIAVLPEAQRRALTLTALEGRSGADAAAEMGVSETSMRQLVHRARNRMRCALSAVMPLPLVTAALRGAGAPGATAVGGAGAMGALSGVAVKGAAVVAIAAGGAGVTAVARQEHPHSVHARGARAVATAKRQPVLNASDLPVVSVTRRVARGRLHEHPGGSGRARGHRGSPAASGDQGTNGNASTTGGLSGQEAHGSAGPNGTSFAAGGTASPNGSDGAAPDGIQGASSTDGASSPTSASAASSSPGSSAGTSHNMHDGG